MDICPVTARYPDTPETCKLVGVSVNVLFEITIEKLGMSRPAHVNAVKK